MLLLERQQDALLHAELHLIFKLTSDTVDTTIDNCQGLGEEDNIDGSALPSQTGSS